MKLSQLSEVSRIDFPCHKNDNGTLCVYEAGASVPFEIRRAFSVSAKAGSTRGMHAHIKCIQLLVCVSGCIKVTYTDGYDEAECELNSGDDGLLLPAGIWAEQYYLTDDALLMVFCDRGYEEDDYIRDYESFKIYRARSL